MAKNLKTAPKIIDYIIQNDNIPQELYNKILQTKIKPDSVKPILYLIKYKYNIVPTVDNLLDCNCEWTDKILEMLELNTLEKMFDFIINNPQYDMLKLFNIITDYYEYKLLEYDVNDKNLKKYIDTFIDDLPKYGKLLKKITNDFKLFVQTPKYETIYDLLQSNGITIYKEVC
jgi:hypothetical protein